MEIDQELIDALNIDPQKEVKKLARSPGVSKDDAVYAFLINQSTAQSRGILMIARSVQKIEEHLLEVKTDTESCPTTD